MPPSPSAIVFETGLNAEATAQVGDTIRAYDTAPMEGRGDCYIEGTVTEKGPVEHPRYGRVIFHGFTIQLTKRVCDGEETVVADGETGYVPFTVSILDWDGRVTRLTETSTAAAV